MRKRAKKLALTLVLSVSLLSMNMNFVYAEEMGLSENPAIDTDTTDSIDNSETVQQTDGGGTEEKEETDISETDENAGQSETGENKNESEAGESVTDGTENENQETDGSGETDENTDATEADDAAAADTTDEETSEKVYVNQDGEEVLPSTLVGVDYNTISELYDGVANVKKQYVFSDTYEKDTIIECSVDEEGNMIMTISLGASKAETTGMEERESNKLEALLGDGSSSTAPAVDGTFSGWDNIPVSYEYNWDNSDNCWQWGNWVTDPETGEQICYKTEEGTYDGDVRHVMQLYCDGDNVYLRITFATIYESHSNGEDFNFYFDQSDTGAKFQITYPEIAGTLTNSTPGAGVYKVDVRNGDTSNSYSIVDGAEAYYLVTDNNINNQLELKIPLEALKAQLREKGIEVSDNFSVLEYTTPNLMYRRIATAGSPTGAVPFSAAVFLLVPASYVLLKRKDDKEDMAFA